MRRDRADPERFDEAFERLYQAVAHREVVGEPEEIPPIEPRRPPREPSDEKQLLTLFLILMTFPISVIILGYGALLKAIWTLIRRWREKRD